MSKSQRLNAILGKAKEKEQKYEWLEAAELYRQALRAVGKKDFLKAGEIQERIGYCFYRGAFQAESQEEFKKRMGFSVKVYCEAAELYERLEDSKKHARINFCRTVVSYRKSWLVEDSPERKALLDGCWKQAKAALKAYEETDDRLGYGKTCNELLTCLYDRQWLTWDWQERKNIMEEVIEYGEKTIEALSETRDEYELARTYYMLSSHYFVAGDTYESIERQNEVSQKSLTYAQKALEISEKIRDSYLIGMSNWAVGSTIMDVKGDFESSLRYAEKQLELGKMIKDNLMIARACAALAYFGWWKMDIEEDPDMRRKGYNRAIQYAKDAITHFQLILHPVSVEVCIPHIDGYAALAMDMTNLEKKRVLLEKAVEVGRTHLDQAKRSESTYVVNYALHCLSKALYLLSTAETKIREKRKMLEEASKYREENIKLNKRFFPFFYWSHGVTYNYSALMKAELAEIETDNQKKIDLVSEAVLDMEGCLKFCRTTVEAWPQTRLFYAIGLYQDRFGGILNQLYLLTGEKRHLERAIRVYEDAAQAWEKTELYSREAEAHWQIAKLHDQLGEHSKAAGEFESAFKRYRLAAEKIPQLRAFFSDHATYMNAWSDIERAKHHHAKKQYDKARERYVKAANLHRSTKRWNYLSSNYLALAQVEEAEDLSRREQTEEARNLFQQANKLFVESKKSIKAKLEELEIKDEKIMAADLAKASDVRGEYSLGRLDLEEAKILDRQGDHAASSRKFGSAAEKFQKVTDAMQSESDRQELKPIVALTRAWQMMTRAEAEASPDLYLEASQLFDETKELTQDEKAKLLALGHSRFCKALEAGTRFEDARDPTFHSTATRHLESASNHYLKAGFKSASEYAKATHMLFDAYMYTHKAEMEAEPEKKAQYYRMAEKLLQTSTGSYVKAKHPEKSEQVQRLLEGVKERRQLAMSLTEVLHAPAITSTTTSFSTPTPTHEQAVGLERFEHADIQANLILRVKEVKVGEDVSLEIELINAGRAPALLIKVEKVIPEGFEVREVPETYRVEGSFLNMKGRRLNPLKTEEVKMVVKPLSKGTFLVNPRIRYLDENGKYKSHEPEPVTITVKELGIKGWIKGER